MNDRFWVRVFAFAAVFNLLVGLPLLIDPGLFGTAGPVPLPKGDWLFPRLAGGLIAAFGIGYLIVAGDLNRNRGIVVIGVIGKSLAVLVSLIYLFNGVLSFTGFLLPLVDLVLVVFFLRFLGLYAER